MFGPYFWKLPTPDISREWGQYPGQDFASTYIFFCLGDTLSFRKGRSRLWWGLSSARWMLAMCKMQLEMEERQEWHWTVSRATLWLWFYFHQCCEFCSRCTQSVTTWYNWQRILNRGGFNRLLTLISMERLIFLMNECQEVVRQSKCKMYIPRRIKHQFLIHLTDFQFIIRPLLIFIIATMMKSSSTTH